MTISPTRELLDQQLKQMIEGDFMIHGMGGLGEVANGLIAAACGAYIC